MRNITLVGIVMIIIGFFLGGMFNSQVVIIQENIPLEQYTAPEITFVETGIIEGSHSVEIKIPAVDDSGKGLVTYMIVQALPGSGKTLANIDNILFFTDTQNSIRVARHVAENVTGKDVDTYDVVYDVLANATVITGPSAGGSLAVATIAALEGKGVDPKVMMTGSINYRGEIGPVGQVKEKAKAAQDLGVTTFLVPPDQSRTLTFNTRKHCETIHGTEFCTIETVQEEVNIADEVDIRIIEVSNVREAMEYLLVDLDE